MVKRLAYVVAGILFLSVGLSSGNAFWGQAKKTADKESAVETKTPAVVPQQSPKVTKESKKALEEQQKAIEAKRQTINAKRVQLNNTEWAIEMQMLSQSSQPVKLQKDSKESKVAKKESDSILFKDNQVGLNSLIRQGFQPTNYTMRIEESGLIIWETMQRSDKGVVAFLKGEIDWDLNKITGVLNTQVNNKTTAEYSFTSTGRKVIIEPNK